MGQIRQLLNYLRSYMFWRSVDSRVVAGLLNVFLDQLVKVSFENLMLIR